MLFFFFQNEYFFNIVNFVKAIIREPNDLRQKSAADISCAEERRTLETTTMTLQSSISRCTTKMNAFFWLSNSKHSFRNQHYSSVIYCVPRAKAISFQK